VLPLVALTQIGITVAFGVLLDTFVVRSILVPALTFELEERVWWPSALARRRRETAARSRVTEAAEPAVQEGRGEAIKREPAAALLDDETRLFEEFEMARHARLREAQDRGQLGDVHPPVPPRQYAEQPQARLVAQETEQVARLTHIYECISSDAQMQDSGLWPHGRYPRRTYRTYRT